MKVLVAQLCLTLCDPIYCSPPSSSVYKSLQARILDWVAIPFSRGSSWPRYRIWVSCIAGRFFSFWAIREAPRPPSTLMGTLYSLNLGRMISTTESLPRFSASHMYQHTAPSCFIILSLPWVTCQVLEVLFLAVMLLSYPLHEWTGHEKQLQELLKMVLVRVKPKDAMRISLQHH